MAVSTRTTKDEMVGWHHWFSGHKFEQTPGESEEQGSLACCSPWGHRVGHDLATEQQQSTSSYLKISLKKGKNTVSEVGIWSRERFIARPCMTSPSNTWGARSISGQEAKISHDTQPKQYSNEFNKDFKNSPHKKRRRSFSEGRKAKKIWTKWGRWGLELASALGRLAFPAGEKGRSTSHAQLGVPGPEVRAITPSWGRMRKEIPPILHPTGAWKKTGVQSDEKRSAHSQELFAWSHSCFHE